MPSMFENKRLCMTHGMQKVTNVAMHLQVPPQNTPLLWQRNSHKHIGSMPELLRCRAIIVVTLNFMYVQVSGLRRKSHSLLDDPRTCILEINSNNLPETMHAIIHCFALLYPTTASN